MIAVRRAGEDDVAALCSLRVAWTVEWFGECADEEFGDRFAAWYELEAARRVTWLASVADAPVGMINIAVFERMPRPGTDSGRWGYIGNAFVLPEYRNQGIGAQLLSAALSFADENAFVRVVLSPSERSVPFYQRAGFAPADGLLLRTLRS